MNKKMYRVLVFSFMLLLFTIGVFLGFGYNENEIASNSYVDTTDEVIESVEDDEVYIYSENTNETVETNADIYEDIMVNITYNYLLCHEEIIESFIEYNTTMETLKEEYIDFDIISETEDTIYLQKDINTNCPNHFLLKILNDYVVIYQVVTEDEINIYKNTEIHINTLRDEIKDELYEGIYIDGLQELYSIIEEIDS